MNDEIKEILRILKSKSKRYEYCLNTNISFSDESYEAYLLLDYITNLQQENEAKTHQIEVLDEIVNYERNIRNDKLQQENETRQQDINNLTYQLAKMKEENERLKEDLKGQEALTLSFSNASHDYYTRIDKASEKSQELKDSIDKSNFDGMTKTILILGINQIQNILQNGSEKDG